MGRRWGKTVLGGTCALVTANAGGHVAWVVPTYRNGAPLWRWCEQQLAPLRASRQVRFSQSDWIIQFRGGGFLGIYSADNADAIRGEAFDLVVLDEAARMAEGVWTDAIQPALADRDGDAILISTPQGLNWFWREWCRGQEDGRLVASWQARSAANPIPSIQQAAERAVDRVPERSYRQEWLAEFVEDSGAVFHRVRERATAEHQADPVSRHEYAFGVDWGKHDDWTVITVVDITLKALVHLERFNRIDYQLQLGRLRSLVQRFEPVVIKAEVNSIGEPLLEVLRNEGLPIVSFTTTNATKQAIIEALVLAFEQGDITILDEPVLVNELLAFQIGRLPSGAYRYAAPAGMHDDCVISLALGWSCARNAGWDWDDIYRLTPCGACRRKYVNRDGKRRCPYCGGAPLLRTG